VPPLLNPIQECRRVGTGLPAQPGGLAGERLIRLALGRALEQPGHLCQQVRPAAREFTQRGHCSGLLIFGEIAPPGVVARLPRELGDEGHSVVAATLGGDPDRAEVKDAQDVGGTVAVGHPVEEELMSRVPGQHVGLQTDAEAFYASLGYRHQPVFMSAAARICGISVGCGHAGSRAPADLAWVHYA
jgi:hypothetical protein